MTPLRIGKWFVIRKQLPSIFSNQYSVISQEMDLNMALHVSQYRIHFRGNNETRQQSNDARVHLNDL